MLARPEGVSATAAARELGCSRRTVYRDLDALEREGFPVHADEDGAGGRWRILSDGRPHDAVPFTRDELAALWLARESLARLDGTTIAAGARSALDKIRAAFSREERTRLDALARAMSVAGVTRDPERVTGAAAVLQLAAETRRTVQLRYRSLPGRASERHLDPYLLWLDPATASLYVAGHDHERRTVAVFALDRIVDATPTTLRFDPPAGWDARAFLADSFAAFHGPPVHVKLELTGRAARLVAERRWHPSQKLDRRDDAVILSMRVPLSPGLRGWVLSWTPDVRVLSPPDLARQVRTALEQALRAHGPGLRKSTRAARVARRTRAG